MRLKFMVAQALAQLFLALSVEAAGNLNEIRIGIIMDPPLLEDFNATLSLQRKQQQKYALDNRTAYAVFESAVSLPQRRNVAIDLPLRIGDLVDMRNDTSSFVRYNGSVGNETNMSVLKLTPVFITPHYSEKMVDDLTHKGRLPMPVALIDVSSCSVDRCLQLFELADQISGISIMSTCCFVNFSRDDIVIPGMGPPLIYESLEPHSLFHLANYLAMMYRWRRFHFVMSPNWPSFDAFFRTLQDAFNDGNDNIILTRSYFCTGYLAIGNLCSKNQAKEILLRQATAIFVLLEPEQDLPNFIGQLRELMASGDSGLLSGKAVFLVHLTGVIGPLLDELTDSGIPDGLMIIRQQRVSFEPSAFRPQQAYGLSGVGTDALLYQELRMVAKAAEGFAGNPTQFGRLSTFFCGSIFHFLDADSAIGYSEHCDRDFATTEIINLKRWQNGSFSFERVFMIRDDEIHRLATPHWLGTRENPPYEDFCKLDGAGCPIPPVDLKPIVVPAVLGSAIFIVAFIALSVSLNKKATERRKQKEAIRALVIIDFDDLIFGPRGASPNERSPSSMSRHSQQSLMPQNQDFRKFQNTTQLTAASPTFSLLREPSNLKNSNFIEKIPQHGVARALFRGEPVFVSKSSELQFDFKIGEQLIEELIQLRDLRHNNLNAFLGVAPQPNSFCLVQAYCQKGTLAQLLAKQKLQLNRIFKMSFINDIASGMAFLHHSSIRSHGQLTSSNIFVDNRWFCKIGSPPVASPFREINNSHALHDLLSVRINLKGHKGSQVDLATLSKFAAMEQPTHQPLRTVNSLELECNKAEFYWTAPELLRMPLAQRPIRGTQPGDLYAFGVIVFEIATRTKPFAHSHMAPNVILAKIQEGTKPPTRPRCPSGWQEADDVKDLLELAKTCWNEIVVARPRFSQILSELKKMNKGKASNLVDSMVEMLETYAENLEDQVAERTAELNDEKKRSEELLSKMLPKYVVDELKQGRIVHPETYDSVTIYFSDIVGFTALAADSNPMEIVKLLNDLYSMFDQVIDSYDVYKVETIGDAYMVASGLPQRNGNRHAGEIATMALDILSCVTHFRIAHRPGKMLQLRCGIHTGPVVAGVVGLKMPRYCLFGDTVNYASRMESSGLALRIHVSPECKQVLDAIGGFHLEERGYVSMKGKGRIVTYFLTGKLNFVKSLPDLELAAPLEDHDFK